MMQNYELMLLLNPNAMDEVDDFLKGLEDIIRGDKGDLVEKKLLGKRQLAYPINNMNYANYVHLDIKVILNFFYLAMKFHNYFFALLSMSFLYFS